MVHKAVWFIVHGGSYRATCTVVHRKGCAELLPCSLAAPRQCLLVHGPAAGSGPAATRTAPWRYRRQRPLIHS